MEKKKFRAIFILLAVLLTIILCGPSVVAEGNGPAPNSGDCYPNGSGLESPFGSQLGRGPAPSSEDGES